MMMVLASRNDGPASVSLAGVADTVPTYKPGVRSRRGS